LGTEIQKGAFNVSEASSAAGGPDGLPDFLKILDAANSKDQPLLILLTTCATMKKIMLWKVM